MARAYIPLPPVPVGDTWELAANPNPPSRVIEADTVHAALLACLDANTAGATLEQCQAAIDEVVQSQNLEANKHKALTLMRWASANRGVGYRSQSGLISRAP